MFVLVCFDIVDDRIRYRVVKLIKNHGTRVQKSVFECASMTEEKFLRLKNQLEDNIDATSDSVRYYILCRGCLQRVEYSGIGELPQTSLYQVV